MTCLTVGIAGLVALFALDRLLIWCELRGWIAYRLTPRPRHAIGNALLAVEEFYRPSRRHVIELQQEGEVWREEDDEGGRRKPGARSAAAQDRIAAPMGVSDGFLDFLLDQLAGLGDVSARRMFGGVGLYAGDVFFGLVAQDALYLKADDKNRGRHEAEGMGPFKPYADRPETMQYYGVPVHVLEDADVLVEWAREAIGAGRRAAADRTTRRTKRSVRSKNRIRRMSR
jgi:DNA transformation protein